MTHPVRLLRAASALALWAMPAVAAESGIEAQFRRWMVGCDNVRTCRAIGLPADDDASDGAALIVDRSGEGSAKPALRLRLNRPDDETKPLQGAFDLAVDDKVLGRLEVGRNFPIERDDAGRWAGDIADPALEAALLAALRTGRSVTARRPDGDVLARISLDGAAAALLFVDDRQRRIGTRGALMRPGDKPDGAVPAPPALPDLPPVPVRAGGAAPKAAPAEVKRLFDADVAREDCDADVAKGAKPTGYRLGARVLMFSFPCWRGAYQGTDAYYLYSETASPKAQPINLPRPPVRPVPGQASEPASPGHMVTGDGYDSASGEIIEYAKGRGLGDCGSVGHWRWTGRGFALTYYSSMPECAGLDHDDWLTLMRSRERE
ncbi:MAG TPA: DUF1176 domain-containing protein [Microvirga sp.]|jgi:hypothetical protein|nr:DUF1176 domain-containing protein [Microvirga sp.]